MGRDNSDLCIFVLFLWPIPLYTASCTPRFDGEVGRVGIFIGVIGLTIVLGFLADLLCSGRTAWLGLCTVAYNDCVDFVFG